MNDNSMIECKVKRTVLAELKKAAANNDPIPLLDVMGEAAGVSGTCVSKAIKALEKDGYIQIHGKGSSRCCVDVETGNRTKTYNVKPVTARRKEIGLDLNEEKRYVSKLERANAQFVDKLLPLIFKMSKRGSVDVSRVAQ